MPALPITKPSRPTSVAGGRGGPWAPRPGPRAPASPSPARAEAEAAIGELESRAKASSPRPPANRDYVGRTWVTRRGVQVARIASAWFVRRFLDPRARFRFMTRAVR